MLLNPGGAVVSSSGVSLNQQKGGDAQGGRHLVRGAQYRGGGMSKYFFRMRCWQLPPVENDLLHNEVDQVGIEGEINVEAVWTPRCRL